MQIHVDYLRKHVSLAREMHIAAGNQTDQWFELLAPLSSNLNDKQTAFGGSLATLCTLSGWCVTAALCQKEIKAFDIAVLESHIRYRLPVTSDPIIARAYFPDETAQHNFIASLKTRKRAKLQLRVEVGANNKTLVSFTGQYYARIVAT